MSAKTEAEGKLLRRMGVTVRMAVSLNWLAVLTIWSFISVPTVVALAAFTIFRVTAICAILWLLIEFIAAIIRPGRALNPLIDAILTLPMFGFWFLVWVSLNSWNLPDARSR